METIQSVLAGSFALLRRPTFQELDYNDALDVLVDLLRGWIQDLDLGGRDMRTAVSDVTLSPDNASDDYLVNLQDIPDFEPIGLEFNLNTGNLSGWGVVRKVDYDVYPSMFGSGRPVCAFYGSTAVPDGVKLRLNIVPEDVANRVWRLSYRLPLLSVVQMGDRPPIPTNMMRMVKLGLAIALAPLVKNNSDEWREWKRENLPIYRAEYLSWDNPDDVYNPGRWREYVNGGIGPTVQPATRFDDHRRQEGSGNARGVTFPGGAFMVRD